MKFIKNAWYAAAWADELSSSLLGRIILGEPILLYRKQDRTAVALSDTCPHRFAPLHKGKLLGDAVQCPYHGLTFDESGACVRNPHGEGKIPKAARLRTYPLAEKDTVIWIWMADPARADPSTIPAFPALNDRLNFAHTAGQVMTMPLRWDLILDNLLDLSHARFLHLGNLGSEAFSRGVMQVEQNGTTLQVNNLYPNGLPAPVFTGTGACKPDDYVDYWVNVRWDPPGSLSFDAGITPTGRPRTEGMKLDSAQLLTPETESSTHYFWRLFRSYRLEDVELTKAIESMVALAFHTEDEPMVAAVQERMRGRDLADLNPVMLSVDSGAVRARRILEGLIAEEARGPVTVEA